MKTIRYVIEYLFLLLFYYGFKIMPLDMASACGGFIGRALGPRLGATRKARKHLQKAMPNLSAQDQELIILGMWDNLGRVFAEYPHLEKIAKERVTYKNAHILETLRDDGLPGIIISGHLANWEVGTVSALEQIGFNASPVYRAPNNPWSDRLLEKARTLNGKIKSIPKSRSGTKQLFKTMQQGGHIAMLIDQKYNEGLPALFFGHTAMTTPAFGQLCQKFSCPLVPIRTERTKGAHFTITIYDPVDVFDKAGNPLSAEDMICTANTMLEDWITEKPEQWLWLHRRWTD